MKNLVWSLGPVEVIITVKECLVNLVYNHCRPVISGYLNQTAYFPDSTVPYADHSVQFKLIIDIPILVKMLYRNALFRVDAGNVEGGLYLNTF